MSVQSLKKLEVWRRAKDFALWIYREVLPILPAEEKWGLNQQLRRSSVSISANIAEGHGRYYYQDNIRFCLYARGSLEETLRHLVFAREAGYMPDSLFERLDREEEEIYRMLNGYIGYLKRSKQGADEPGASHAVFEAQVAYSIAGPDDFQAD